MRAPASWALPLHPGKRCPARLIAFDRPASSPAFATDPIALMGTGMGRNSTRGHPSPWAGRARAEAELPHIDPRRGVLSAELGLTRVERTEWLRAKPPRGRAAELRAWGAPIGSAPRTFRLAPSALDRRRPPHLGEQGRRPDRMTHQTREPNESSSRRA